MGGRSFTRRISVLAALAAAVIPRASFALEVRTATGEGDDGLVRVAAGETVDDSLLGLGRAVVVEGTVDGDLVALARRVVVRGTVRGDLLTAAESVSIEGRVAGNVVGFGRSVETLQGSVAGNLYGFGETLVIGRDARVEGDATLFAENGRIAGGVGRDVLGFARELELGGTVARNATFFGEQARILPGARIGGDLTLHLPDADNAHIAENAVIAGESTTEVRRAPAERHRFLAPGYYGFQLARLAAAFVVALILYALAPSLAAVPLGSGVETLKLAGLGLVAMIVLPIAAALLAVTLIGVPLALLAVFAWVTALYLAKIVIAGYVGDALLARHGERARRPLALLAGLVVVLIAIALPVVGGFVHFVLLALGVGVLLKFLRGGTFVARPPAAAEA